MAALRLVRSEKVQSVIFPLMGSRNEDHVCFEYIPVSVGPTQVRFAIPPWVAARETLHIGELVNFHISFAIDTDVFNQGRIVATEWDEALGSPVYRANFEATSTIRDAVFLSIMSSGTQSLTSTQVQMSFPEDHTLKDTFCSILKDSVHLKKGVSVFLKHLFPYFSRVAEYPTKKYPLLQKVVLDQIASQVTTNQSRLRSLYEKHKADDRSIDEILRGLDFEELRGLVESEIPMEVLGITFASTADAPALKSPRPYLTAIHELEKKLYTNYNIIASLYVQRLPA